MSPPKREIPWPATEIRSPRTELHAPATQLVGDREDYLRQGLRDIGRRLADDLVELFVEGDPANVLQQQFERLAPDFIALHDVGTSATLHLLNALAGAAGARVQRLSIRRQGQGVALATIQFVELPAGDGPPVRMYTTDVNADTSTRQRIANVLLSRSRLAVLMVGNLPPHALESSLGPLRAAIASGSWPNREILMMPLATSAALAAQATQLVGASGVSARVTPQAARPDDAWSFISGAWNRLHAAGANPAPLNTEMPRAVARPAESQAEAATQPMPLAPPGRGPAPGAVPSARWAEYAQRCAALKGVLSCCIFDMPSQQPLAHAGSSPSAQALTLHGNVLMQSMSQAAHAIGLGVGPGMVLPEAAISFGTQHLLLRPVPGHPGAVLCMVLQASSGSLTLARLQLERVPLPA